MHYETGVKTGFAQLRKRVRVREAHDAEKPHGYGSRMGAFGYGNTQYAYFMLHNRTSVEQVAEFFPGQLCVWWPRRLGLIVHPIEPLRIPPNDRALLAVGIARVGGDTEWRAPHCVLRMKGRLKSGQRVRATRMLGLDLPA